MKSARVRDFDRSRAVNCHSLPSINSGSEVRWMMFKPIGPSTYSKSNMELSHQSFKWAIDGGDDAGRVLPDKHCQSLVVSVSVQYSAVKVAVGFEIVMRRCTSTYSTALQNRPLGLLNRISRSTRCRCLEREGWIEENQALCSRPASYSSELNALTRRQDAA